MGGMKKLTSNYITMLPEKWCYCKAGSANQNIFRIQLKRKNHPPKFKTIMKKNLLVWAAGYASGRAAGRDLIILLEQGSSFVQQLQPIIAPKETSNIDGKASRLFRKRDWV